MKMQQRSGVTERTSTSGNERVATENERSNPGNLMILQGGGGVMSAHQLKQVGIGGPGTTTNALNTVKNNDQRIKFTGGQ